MAETEIYTFRDSVEHVVDHLDVPLTARNQRLARQAVLTAYRRLPAFTRWKSLERRATLLTTASYSTGTVAYDHTGGANERQLTLTDGTWPTDAADGKVVIDSVAYIITSRVSTTVVTLDPNSNPGADVTSGTSYEWYRSTYPLPVDFRKMCRMWDVDSVQEIVMIPTDMHHAASINFHSTPGQPVEACIRGTGDYYNAMSIEFGPPPDAAYYYDYIYEAAPRTLLVEKYTTGTVTTSGTAVTGNATVFPANCVGSIIRFGTTTVEPTSLIGGYNASSAWVDNPYVAQRVITARGGDTAITIDSALTSNLTTVKYTISDPIDLFLPAMYTAFERLAEAEFARLTNHEKFPEREAVAMQEIRRAMENDQLHTYSPGGVYYNRFKNVTITTD
jgi:hypothetical protein